MSEDGIKRERIAYTKHAETVMAERRIDPIWVERIIRSPERSGSDPMSPERTRVFGRVAEFGGRWLRVVYEVETEAILIVTAFFDRNAGRES